MCDLALTLPLALYKYETSPMTLSWKRRLRAFGTGVTRKIYGYEREKLTGGWRKLHNEELYDLYFLSHTIMMIKED
jgi:hypothetical protein